MTDDTPTCGEDCSCGVAEADTETVEVPITLGLSTFIREHVEEFSDISPEDDVKQMTVCHEQVTAEVVRG